MSAATSERGFTLVEILVVLIVMGVLVSLVAVNLRQDDRDVLRTEAERLAQVLDIAADEARISGKSLAWTANDSSYRFWRLGPENEWSEIRDNDILRARRLSPGVTISELRVEAMRALESKRLEFRGGSLTLAYSIGLSLGAESLVVSASPIGEVLVSAGNGVPHAEPAQR